MCVYALWRPSFGLRMVRVNSLIYPPRLRKQMMQRFGRHIMTAKRVISWFLAAGYRSQGERREAGRCVHYANSRKSRPIVRGAIHQGVRRNLVSLDGTVNRHRYMQILRDHMPSWARGFFGRNYESRHEPNRTCLGSNVNLDTRHGPYAFQSGWIALSCLPSVASRSGEKGENTGGELASSCAGCYHC